MDAIASFIHNMEDESKEELMHNYLSKQPSML